LIRAIIPNPNGVLIPGQSGRARIAEDSAYDHLLVADQAIVNWRGLNIVYVVTPEGKANATRVSVGQKQDGLRIVRSGLKNDDKIVVDGFRNLNPNRSVTFEERKMEDYASEELNGSVVSERKGNSD